MSLGYKRDGELAALMFYARITALLSKENPGVRELEQLQRRSYLMLVSEMSKDKSEMEQRRGGVADDRLADCRECESENGCRACIKNGKYVGCRYRKAKFIARYLEQKVGRQTLELLVKYSKDGG